MFEFSGIAVRQQPDDVSCGPTCLQAVYAFHGMQLDLNEVIQSVQRLDHGGTLGVLLGVDALKRGFDVTLFTYNLEVFDPSWFVGRPRNLPVLLERRLQMSREGRRSRAIEAYLDFLDRGGQVRHRELTPQLLASMARSGVPPLTGLSATYLYGCEREVYEGGRSSYDDVLGDPTGHFVIISGVDQGGTRFRISDPSTDNPRHGSGTYWVDGYRLVGAILLGVTTYDGNILIIRRRD